MGGQVRTWSGTSERVRGTHKLDSTDGWVSQDAEQARGTHKLEGTDGWASQDREQVSE